MQIKKYVKKNGEVKIYEYDNKKYNKKFYEKHKEKLCGESIQCECGGRYKHINKSHHNKTQRHLKFLSNVNNNAESLHEEVKSESDGKETKENVKSEDRGEEEQSGSKSSDENKENL